MRICPALISAMAIASLIHSHVTAAPAPDPCRIRGPAAQLELSAYTRTGWVESYVIYTNDKGEMISTWGTVWGWIDSRPFGADYWNRENVLSETHFDCKEFQYHTRGVANELVLLYLLPKVKAPPSSGMLNRLCIRHWATYMPGKIVCDDF